jgi:hypothetical protein
MSERCEECGCKIEERSWGTLDRRSWCSRKCFELNTKEIGEHFTNRATNQSFANAYQQGWVARGSAMEEDEPRPGDGA